MTITVLPMDATAGAPAYSAKNARQAQASLYGNPTARVFGTRSGWRVGTLSSIVAVTSTTWTLNPSACMIEPAASLYQGAYGWASDQVITGPVTAADGTNPRIDILYIQVNDSSAGDGSGGLSANVSYLAGTAAPAGTQVAPTLPPRSFLVATIAVPKLAGGSPTITLNKAYFTAAGGLLPVLSQADRDTLTPYAGMPVWRLDGSPQYLQVYDGTAWQSIYAGDTGWLAPTVFGNGFTAYVGSGYDGVKYRKVGGVVYVSGVANNTGSWAGGVAICALPAGYIPARKYIGTNCVVDTSGNVLTTGSGSATTTTFSASFPVG